MTTTPVKKNVPRRVQPFNFAWSVKYSALILIYSFAPGIDQEPCLTSPKREAEVLMLRRFVYPLDLFTYLASIH